MAGQLIVIPGTCHKQLYFITRGYADVYLGKLLVDTLAAGDSFGEPVRARGRDAQPTCVDFRGVGRRASAGSCPCSNTNRAWFRARGAL
jgi:hypothetical protein